jgi:hypothetical protein
MTTGVVIYDPNGNIIFDATNSALPVSLKGSRTTELSYTFTVPAGNAQTNLSFSLGQVLAQGLQEIPMAALITLANDTNTTLNNCSLQFQQPIGSGHTSTIAYAVIPASPPFANSLGAGQIVTGQIYLANGVWPGANINVSLSFTAAPAGGGTVSITVDFVPVAAQSAQVQGNAYGYVSQYGPQVIATLIAEGQQGQYGPVASLAFSPGQGADILATPYSGTKTVQITTATTTSVKSSGGTVGTLLNSSGAATGNVAIYNATSATGTPIWQGTLAAGQVLPIGVPCNAGITVVTAAANAITLSYQ